MLILRNHFLSGCRSLHLSAAAVISSLALPVRGRSQSQPTPGRSAADESLKRFSPDPVFKKGFSALNLVCKAPVRSRNVPPGSSGPPGPSAGTGPATEQGLVVISRVLRWSAYFFEAGGGNYLGGSTDQSELSVGSLGRKCGESRRRVEATCQEDHLPSFRSDL